jgi:predicted NBD/HSP70 family sugar kinase
VLRFGPRPRTELASRLGLSVTTLSRTTRELLDTGLLRTLDPIPQLAGRPQEPLDVDEAHARFIGMKVLPDQVLAAVVTVRGNALEEVQEPLDAPTPERILEIATELCEALLEAHPRIAGVGVGIGGRVDGNGVVLSSNMLNWSRPVPFAAPLSSRLGLPVSVTNDFHALMHGLNWFGVGRRYPNFLLLTIGQGVALGMVQDGVVREGRSHLAGLTQTLRTVTRDGRGLPLREVASNEAVLERARSEGLIDARGSLDTLLDTLHEGDERVVALSRDIAFSVAASAADVIGVVDPDALVIGGEAVELLADESGFAAALREALAEPMRDLALHRLPPDFDDWARGAGVIAVRQFIGKG